MNGAIRTLRTCHGLQKYQWMEGALLLGEEQINWNLLNRLHGEPDISLDVLVFNAYNQTASLEASEVDDGT